MRSRISRLLLPFGLLCVCLSVLIGRIDPGTIPRADFFEGLFMGMAVALSVAGLIVAGFARS